MLLCAGLLTPHGAGPKVSSEVEEETFGQAIGGVGDPRRAPGR